MSHFAPNNLILVNPQIFRIIVEWQHCGETLNFKTALFERGRLSVFLSVFIWGKVANFGSFFILSLALEGPLIFRLPVKQLHLREGFNFLLLTVTQVVIVINHQYYHNRHYNNNNYCCCCCCWLEVVCVVGVVIVTVDDLAHHCYQSSHFSLFPHHHQ